MDYLTPGEIPKSQEQVSHLYDQEQRKRGTDTYLSLKHLGGRRVKLSPGCAFT